MKPSPSPIRRGDLRTVFVVGTRFCLGPVTLEIQKVEEKTITARSVAVPAKPVRAPIVKQEGTKVYEPLMRA